MTFKECRKYGREEINKTGLGRGFMYKDMSGDWTFSFTRNLTNPPIYCLEKSGVVDKIVDGHWQWDFERRGHHPNNEKGWNKRGDT